jgi:hypothetical protein
MLPSAQLMLPSAQLMLPSAQLMLPSAQLMLPSAQLMHIPVAVHLGLHNQLPIPDAIRCHLRSRQQEDATFRRHCTLPILIASQTAVCSGYLVAPWPAGLVPHAALALAEVSSSECASFAVHTVPALGRIGRPMATQECGMPCIAALNECSRLRPAQCAPVSDLLALTVH